MAYPPIQAWNNAEPTDKQKAKHGAAELRAIKLYLTAIPQIPMPASVTMQQDDTENSAGKHYYHTSGTAHALTIPTNAVVPFRTGSIVNCVNEIGGGVVTIAKSSGVTLVLGGSGLVTTIAIAANGSASIMKVATDRWYVTGVGLTGTP
jgi:hypothetical protein